MSDLKNFTIAVQYQGKMVFVHVAPEDQVIVTNYFVTFPDGYKNYFFPLLEDDTQFIEQDKGPTALAASVHQALEDFIGYGEIEPFIQDIHGLNYIIQPMYVESKNIFRYKVYSSTDPLFTIELDDNGDWKVFKEFNAFDAKLPGIVGLIIESKFE